MLNLHILHILNKVNQEKYAYSNGRERQGKVGR